MDGFFTGYKVFVSKTLVNQLSRASYNAYFLVDLKRNERLKTPIVKINTLSTCIARNSIPKCRNNYLKKTFLQVNISQSKIHNFYFRNPTFEETPNFECNHKINGKDAKVHSLTSVQGCTSPRNRVTRSFVNLVHSVPPSLSSQIHTESFKNRSNHFQLSNHVNSSQTKIATFSSSKTFETTCQKHPPLIPQEDQENGSQDQFNITTFRELLKNIVDITRIKNPVGYILLFYPFAISIAMATTAHPEIIDYSTAILTSFGYFIGCVLMRSSGCIVNDLWDMKIDRQVKRTRNRPLSSGRIGIVPSISAAAVFALSTLLGGIILIDPKTLIVCTIFACASGFYPLAKRVFPVPQLVLGSIFSGGSIIGWMHLCKSIDFSVCLPLYAACICWTLIYDTIYAMQDVEDDKRIGINSSVIFLGKNLHMALSLLTLIMSLFLALSGYMNGQGPFFYLLSVLLPGILLFTRVILSKNKNASAHMRSFNSNMYLGVLILLGIIIDRIFCGTNI